MNAYLSKQENEHFIRLNVLAQQMETVLGQYQNSKNLDKEFAKCLKTSKTWLLKGLEIRIKYLDKDTRQKLLKQYKDLELIFVPTREAKKVYQELENDITQVHMSKNDFEDWYCEVIEHTCKNCDSSDFTGCRIREILSSAGIYPVNVGATTVCQYSYIENQEILAEIQKHKIEKQLILAEKLAEEKNNKKIEETSTMQEPEELEKIKEGHIKVEMWLKNGQYQKHVLPQRMASNILSEFEKPKGGAVTALHIDNQLLVIDTQDIVTVKIDNISVEMNRYLQTPVYPEQSNEKEIYKVECKCGAEYTCNLPKWKTQARCRQCNQAVFYDKTAGEEMPLLTNNYYVEV